MPEEVWTDIMQAMFCNNCHALLRPGSTQCHRCRQPVDENNVSAQMSLVGFENAKPERKHEYQVNNQTPYFPYVPREGQLDIVEDIRDALDGGKHIVVESGTGTGKTIVSLAAGLEHAKAHQKTLIYLTRTISQSDQVMRELKAINVIRPVSGITITGRNRSCPLFEGPEYTNVPSNVLSLMCDDRKQNSRRNHGPGCIYFDRVDQNLDNLREFCKGFPTSDELMRYCKSLNVCPYEARKALMKDFDVITAPYIQIVSEDIRKNLLSTLGLSEENILLIIDEAHNFIDAAREQESFSITSELIESAIEEARVIPKAELYENILLADFLKALKQAGRALGGSHLGLINEAKLPPMALEEFLMERFGINEAALQVTVDKFTDYGEARMDAIMESGTTSSSPLYDLSILLTRWIARSNNSYVRTIKASPEGEVLHAACIDPFEISQFLRKIPGALHMSGTLTPLEQYSQIMGLPKNTKHRTYPSPFPAENKKVVYMPELTTRFEDMKKDPSMKKRITDTICDLCNSVQKNTLVFMPSYRLMNEMRGDLEYGINKRLYWEESGKQKSTMMNLDLFRKGTDGVFVCVMGGSIAEGIDFPGDELCFAIIVGLPYPSPSIEQNAMSEMFDSKYGPGKGWKYLSETPMLRKVRQAIGRLIRTETDRGMAVIIDKRASRYAKELEATVSSDPVPEAIEFFYR